MFLSSAALPGVPVDLRASRVGEDFVEMEWDAPKSDGGSAIINYHLEISAFKPGDWQKLAKVSAYDTYCRAVRLEEDMDYYFAVCAENSLGKGEFCEMTKPVKTKRGLCKYFSFYYMIYNRILYIYLCTYCLQPIGFC